MKKTMLLLTLILLMAIAPCCQTNASENFDADEPFPTATEFSSTVLAGGSSELEVYLTSNVTLTLVSNNSSIAMAAVTGKSTVVTASGVSYGRTITIYGYKKGNTTISIQSGNTTLGTINVSVDVETINISRHINETYTITLESLQSEEYSIQGEGVKIQSSKKATKTSTVSVNGSSVTTITYETTMVLAFTEAGSLSFDIIGSSSGQVKACIAEIEDHVWNSEYTIDVQATSTSEGQKSIHCSICDAIDEDTITSIPLVKNGLTLNDDGVWAYYEDNEVDTDFNGIAVYDNDSFFVANGYLCSDAQGLNLYDGKWYFLAYGQVQTQYTGLALYDEEWFYITEGILDTSKTGLVSYDGEQFLFAEGRLLLGYNGLWLNSTEIGGNNQWYFIAAGMVQNVSQVVMYDGAWFVVENGILDSDYNGTIEYNGSIFNVVNGQLYG